MTSVFYLWILIFTKFLLVSSVTLDIHYPENGLMHSDYDGDYPYKTSFQRVNPYELQCDCQPSCQCPFEYSSLATYRHQPVNNPQPVYKPQPVYNPQPVCSLPNIPTPPPVIIPPLPPTITPPFPTIQPSQFAPNVHSSNDQTKYNTMNYEHSHSENTQNHRRNIRSPQLYSEIIRPSNNFQESNSQQQNIYRCYSSIPPSISPGHQANNVINPIKTDYNREGGSIPVRGHDSRSTLESSKIQNGNDVATQSSIITPKHSSNSSININHIINKRGMDVSPLAYGKGLHQSHPATTNKNNTATINDYKKLPQTTLSPYYVIVGPSRKLVKENATSISDSSNVRSNYAGPDNIYINNQYAYPLHSTGKYGHINNAHIMADTVRSSGSSRGRVYYPTGYPTSPTYIAPQRRLENLPVVAAVPSVYPAQSPLATFAQQPISTYGVNVGDRSYSTNRYLSSLRSAGSMSLPPSPPPINHNTHVIHTSNVKRNNDETPPQWLMSN